MARVKRVVRKLGEAREQGIDAQFWPVVVALCVLTSFVLGAVLTLLRGPMLWLSLMLMPAGLAAAIIALASINHRRVRRTLQLAIILSMIAHIIFVLSAYRVDVFDRWLAQSSTRTRSRAPQSIQVPVEQEERPWEQVNVTETPEVQQPIEELEQEQVEQTVERPQPTPVEQAVEQQVNPNRIERTNPSRTSPQFSQQQSKLSRSEQNQSAQTSTSAEQQVTNQEESSSSPSSDAREQQVARSEATPEVQRPATETPESTPQVNNKITRQRTEPETSATPEPQQDVARRENSRPTPRAEIETQALVENSPSSENTTQPNADSSTTRVAETTPLPRRQSPSPNTEIRPRTERPELPAEVQPSIAQTEQPRPNRRQRQTDRPEVTAPATDVAAESPRRTINQNNAPAPSTSAQVEVTPQQQEIAQTTNPSPNNSSQVERRQSNPNQTPRRSRDPSESQSIAVNPSNSRNENATRRPRAESESNIARAETPTSRPRTRADVTPNANTQAANVESDAAAVQATEVAANPSSNNVTRQPTRDPSTSRQQNALPENTTGLVTQVPRVSPNADARSTQPSISTNQQTELPRRTLNSSDLAQTPTNAESPTEAPATEGNQLTPSPPEQFAVDRSTQGIAGIGDTRNLDRDVPANERPAISPSNSADRPRSTSRDPGQSFQPSQPSQVRQSLAGQLVPSSSVEAEIQDGVGIPASNMSGSVDAQASATTIDSRSPSAPGDVSALRGSSSIDLGPPKIVRNESDGRGAGGGQPEPNAQNSPVELERTDRGSLQSSIASNVTADIPRAPREDGNTGTIDAYENPSSNSLARSRADGEQPVQGGPTNADLDGPTDLTSEAPEVDGSPLVRAEAGDAILDDTEPGGGDLDDEDEEERERRRRLAQSGGGETGQLAVQTRVELPSGMTGEQADEPNAVAGSVDASDTQADRVASADGTSGDVQRPMAGGEVSGADSDVGEVELARGEVSDGLEGMATPGGGTLESRSRSNPTASIAGNVGVESITGIEPGTDNAAPASGLEASDTEATRIAGSTEGVLRSTLGMVASQLVGPSIVALPPVVLGPSGQPREPGTGESIGEPSSTGGSSRRDSTTGPQINTQVEVDLVGNMGNAAEPGSGSIGDGLTPSDVNNLRRSRSGGGGIEVDVAADDGPGGIGVEVSPQVGIDDRRARLDDGPIQAFADARFVRDEAGGVPTFNPSATIPSDAFRSRQPLGGGRGSPQTEEAIEMGLAFLARHQQPEGHWKLETFGTGTGDDEDEMPVFRSDAAATALALLAFQGAGYNHKEYKYAAQVDRAVQWLVDHQDENGCLYVTSDEESNKYSRLYSHGIAALALCEAYGMTQDPELKLPAQRALDYIVDSQDKERGGWRYTPGRASDTSVSGWMMMALKSGQFAGLDVPQETYDRFEQWLTRAQVKGNPHQYAYNPYAKDTEEQRHGREASRSMTSVALLMRLYMGWDRERVEMQDGTDYILEQLPADGTSLERDTYYWYYATQVVRHMGGERWAAWNAKLHPLLIRTQVREPQRFQTNPLAGPDEIIEDNSLVGSWDPLTPVPDAWGITGGRIYVTTLNLLSLEVDYRLMPLYKNTVE